MNYTPAPIDTSRVALPAELDLLTERLAKNTHDLWARQRFKDGWVWGAQRDDSKKRHPCLVPYEELPESEKIYDRETALGTLKAIIALGYKIERNKPG